MVTGAWWYTTLFNTHRMMQVQLLHSAKLVCPNRYIKTNVPRRSVRGNAACRRRTV